VDAPPRAALRDVLAARAEAAGFEAKLAAVAQERAAIGADQKRLRENLGSLGDRATEKELRERFVRALGKQEDRLEELKTEEARLTADRDAARARLAARLAALDYDGAVG
jgi:septal ring factor EnvC (AmiA/AmiB activator)